MMPLKLEGHRTPIWFVHYYRNEYGDAGYKALPHFEEPSPEDVKNALIERFADPKRGYEVANKADVLDEFDEIVFRAGMISPGEARVFPPRTAS
jgi:hypothetical protein